MIQDVRIVDGEGAVFGPIALVKYIGKALHARRSAKQRHFIEHEGVSVEVDADYVSAPIEDGDLELARYYRDGQHLVMIYHWTM